MHCKADENENATNVSASSNKMYVVVLLVRC